MRRDTPQVVCQSKKMSQNGRGARNVQIFMTNQHSLTHNISYAVILCRTAGPIDVHALKKRHRPTADKTVERIHLGAVSMCCHAGQRFMTTREDNYPIELKEADWKRV